MSDMLIPGLGQLCCVGLITVVLWFLFSRSDRAQQWFYWGAWGYGVFYFLLGILVLGLYTKEMFFGLSLFTSVEEMIALVPLLAFGFIVYGIRVVGFFVVAKSFAEKSNKIEKKMQFLLGTAMFFFPTALGLFANFWLPKLEAILY